MSKYRVSKGRKKDKKAILVDTLMIVILAAVIAIIFLILAFYFKQALKTGGDIETCRLSVLANAKMKNTVGIDCPKNEINLGMKDFRDSGKLGVENAVKRELAEEMRLCWYKMGEGMITPFEDMDDLKSRRYCVICSEISFDKDISKKYPAITGFGEYLLRTPIRPGSDETSYTSYLSNGIKVLGDSVQKEDELERSKIDDKIYTDKTYLVVFSLSTEDIWKRNTWAGSGLLLGTGAAVVAVSIIPLSVPIFGTAVMLFSIGAVTGGGLTGYFVGATYVDHISTTSLIPMENFNDLDCMYIYQ